MEPADGCGRYCMTNIPPPPTKLIASQHLVSFATNATVLMYGLTGIRITKRVMNTIHELWLQCISEHELYKHYNMEKKCYVIINVTSVLLHKL